MNDQESSSTGDHGFEYEQMLAVIDALPDPVFILTESGRYAGIVGGKDTRFYHDGSVLVNHTLHEVLPREKADWFLDQIRQTLEEDRLRSVEYNLGGEEVEGLDTEQGPAGMLWFEGRIQPLTSLYGGERAVVWVARNITERYQLESRLRDLSEHDELTGLYNRRKLLDELNHRYGEFRRYQHQTSLLMIDVDNFKNINDNFGHLAGDQTLVHIARQCRIALRESDQLARYGGEEFAAILPNSDLCAAETVAERIRNLIASESKFPIEDVSGITVSIGVCQFHDTDSNEETILRRTDEALYRAKNAGRNRVISCEISHLL
jgi:diguanylate cyclase (GGDEF)-like protein